MQNGRKKKVDSIGIDRLICKRVPIVARISWRSLMKFRIQILRLIHSRTSRSKKYRGDSEGIVSSKYKFLPSI